MHILISGSSGLIGRALSRTLQQQDHSLYYLIRGKGTQSHHIYWNPDTLEIDSQKIEGLDAIIHLGGENISGLRWTRQKKARIRNSRIHGTQFLSASILKLKNPPKIFLCASAIGYYGDRSDQILTEKDGPGIGFLAQVCQDWEKACDPLRQHGIRVANLRFGMVLSPQGGALPKMCLPFKDYLGGPIANGKQYMSWISIHDLCSAIQFILSDPNIRGPINCVSPNPVTNYVFTKTLGRVLDRPSFISLPAWLLKCMMGEMAQDLLLSSTRAVPQKLLDHGFTFQFPNLEEALSNILS
ncbi:MAG: TIGR01777 family oxidoreductase [Chlamydiota bacterium]|nr:TIGR01777 family oxidoreductase [Chlamydiota bacterium]